MSKDILNRLNRILYLRSEETKKEREDRRRRLEGKIKVEYPSNESFDNYFKKHISEGLKTRNIRGLFRIPESNIVIDVKERREAEEEPKVQLPFNSEEQNLHLPGNIDEPQEEQNRVRMSYPTRKPDVPKKQEEEEEIPLLRKKQPQVSEVIDKDKTIDFYIQQAKMNPEKNIAVINKNTGTPKMVLRSDETGTKIYSGTMSMIPKYFDEDKGLLRDEGDIAYETRYPMKGFTKKDLPPDVKIYTTTYYSDDDDDQDPGQKIKLKNIKEKREEEEEEKSNIPYMDFQKTMMKMTMMRMMKN